MKRIAAFVLADLACEIARAADGSLAKVPFAVIVDEEVSERDDGDRIAQAQLDAVDPLAWRYGARPGQRAAAASGYVGKLRIVRIERRQIREALEAVAEVALVFGMTAALSLAGGIAEHVKTQARLSYPGGAGAGPLDTVWLDVSGCARLVGGEDVLAAELRERARGLGHGARVVIADGPRIAQALGRWGAGDEVVVPSGSGASALAPLPTAALCRLGSGGVDAGGLDPELCVWLGKLGILCLEDLARLERASLAHRLGPRAQDLLELLAGRDRVPLVAYQPANRVLEEAHFEEHGVDAIEPLMFVLRGLVSRAAARLGARGEACRIVRLELGYQPSLVRLAAGAMASEQVIELPLPIALRHEEELTRTLRARLERVELAAPLARVRLVLDQLVEATGVQLDLGGGKDADPSALPSLCAELGAWLGEDRVGVLSCGDSHRPEARSLLVPVGRSEAPVRAEHPEPTRVLAQPVPLAATGIRIERSRPSERLDGVEWWTGTPLSRDYARAWVRLAGGEHAEAWVFVDRASGASYLHGWFS